jgi:hypothetical protein
MTNELKSKIFTLGNKMAQTLDRHDAFIRAWQIVKAGSIEIRVAGVTFGNRQTALRRLAAYNPSQVRAYLAPEPGNPVDHSAIAVMVGVNNGKGFYKLGYVPHAQTGMAKALIGKLPQVRVLAGDIYGARLSLAV